MAVLVGPAGRAGGSIVTVPVSADASGRRRRRTAPARRDGRPAAAGRAGRTSWSCPRAELDRRRGRRRGAADRPARARRPDRRSISPRDVTDARGRGRREAGAATMDAAQAAGDPHGPRRRRCQRPSSTRRPAPCGRRWAGAAPARTTAAGRRRRRRRRPIVDDLLAGCTGAVSRRPLRSGDPVAADDNPRGCRRRRSLDPAELALVFGQIAPGSGGAEPGAVVPHREPVRRTRSSRHGRPTPTSRTTQQRSSCSPAATCCR